MADAVSTSDGQKSIRLYSGQLGIDKNVVHRILKNLLCLRDYKYQTVQALSDVHSEKLSVINIIQ